MATGWDLGGAHLKAARSSRRAACRRLQVPCTLVARHGRADALARRGPPAAAALAPPWRHHDRRTRRSLRRSRRGVARLEPGDGGAASPATELRVYAGRRRLSSLRPASTGKRSLPPTGMPAPAFVATRCPQALFVDIGSTTSRSSSPSASGQVECGGLHRRRAARDRRNSSIPASRARRSWRWPRAFRSAGGASG